MENQSNHSTENPTDLISKFLASIQFNPYTDKLYLYLIFPLASFGALFNLVSLFIFCKKSFNQLALFKYIRVYTFSSFIVSFSLIFFILLTPFTFYDLSISYISRVYMCKILNYISVFFFFYQNTLDIFISIERALSFSTGFKNLKKKSPYLICFIVFLMCGLVNLPNNLVYDIVSNEDLYIKFKYCEISAFTQSSLGKILLIISFVVQGPIVLIGEITTNIISMVSFKSFMRRKAELNAQRLSVNESELERRKRLKIEKMNRQLLFMTFYLGIFSALNHVVQFSSQFVLFIFNLSPSVGAWFIFIFAFAVTLKNFSNIFFYYHFNKQFRYCFYKLLGSFTQETH